MCAFYIPAVYGSFVIIIIYHHDKTLGQRPHTFMLAHILKCVGDSVGVCVCVEDSFLGEAVRLAPAGSAVGSVVLLGDSSPSADPKAYKEGL